MNPNSKEDKRNLTDVFEDAINLFEKSTSKIKFYPNDHFKPQFQLNTPIDSEISSKDLIDNFDMLEQVQADIIHAKALLYMKQFPKRLDGTLILPENLRPRIITGKKYFNKVLGKVEHDVMINKSKVVSELTKRSLNGDDYQFPLLKRIGLIGKDISSKKNPKNRGENERINKCWEKLESMKGSGLMKFISQNTTKMTPKSLKDYCDMADLESTNTLSSTAISLNREKSKISTNSSSNDSITYKRPQSKVITIKDDESDNENNNLEFQSASSLLKKPVGKNSSDLNSKKSTNSESKLTKQFVNPVRLIKNEFEDSEEDLESHEKPKKKKPKSSSSKVDGDDSELTDERLKNIEPQMIERIKNEIMNQSLNLTWNDIAGLDHAKNLIQEIVVWPMMRPDIFKGLLGPPKGLLLFGPPGTGKTLIGRCIASQSGATFFSISSSSLTSKWIGDGEKMVRALFAVARCHQPAVIFVDEIDSLLTQRTDGEVEASRRIKTEFLVQLDGCATSSDDRVLVIGATNRPQEIDEAARRRFRKRVYIPLPEQSGRQVIINNLISLQKHNLSPEDMDHIAKITEGYSGSDMDGLCREAAIGPIRSIRNIQTVTMDDVRPVELGDFISALKQVRASVDSKELDFYIDWNNKFGSLS